MEAEIKKYIVNHNMQNCFHITGWVENPMEYIRLFDVA